ncbi:putative sigma-adaptin 3, putative,adaptor complex AP-3 small subunit [Trypanosoma rangeli]|uniref:Putative sigma-adaptin 3, putative,adaptor complex AP-3 small subunit n=1 Tax=Trypanosoma rangeli TaxID=5698 RepID=A0A422NBW9_TRYRA|nr:putative sigma-adaptin 3, putative,adaptor complex AP-3 small subunit [Trypanosoma rangeli]RNF03000.1 putative sigma-adaptin 3, putative,adaptor complex AP-3 small subunit [Trypanosoma rangeli]|eukprot:RNF03000.1 putative sigma-adaptin 3, putative,adaptor complex AP-3 small subunit [Trypanosoma rangeli]
MSFGRGVVTERGVLPLTVDELVESYQHTQHINEELCTFIDNIRVECNRITETFPHAAQALRELFAAASRENTAAASLLISCKVNDSSVHGRSLSNTCSVVDDGGGVLEGVAVRRKTTTEVPHATAISSTKSRFLRFVEEAKHDYKEECGVLRLKLLAMESEQKLLLHAQQKLWEQEKKHVACVSSLDACCNELAMARSQCSFLLVVLNGGEAMTIASPVQHVIQQISDRTSLRGRECDGSTAQTESEAAEDDSMRSLAARLVQTEISLQESQAAVKSLEDNVRKLEYSNDQLGKRLGALTAERDTLKLQNGQLEGQLHRLLSLFHDHPEARQRIQDGEGAKTVLACEAKKGLEKDKMREVVEQLRRENRGLQNSLLQLQRQVNDSELRTEEMYAAGNGDILLLKEEVARLNDALRKRQFAFEQARHDGEKAAARWELLDKVHRTVIHHLSTRLMYDVARRFCPSSSFKGTPAKRPSPISTEELKIKGANATLLSSVAAAEGPEMRQTQEEVTAVVVESSFSQSGNDTRVQELLSLIESKDAQHRIALKHWQQVNQELRSALANSQGELKRCEERIKAMERAKDASVSHATTYSQGDVGDMYGTCAGDDSAKARPTSLQEHTSVSGWKPIKKAGNETRPQRVLEIQEGKPFLNILWQGARERCSLSEWGARSKTAAINSLPGSATAPSATTDPSAVAVDLSGAIPIRNLQRMLHDVLQENMALAARVEELENS